MSVHARARMWADACSGRPHSVSDVVEIEQSFDHERFEALCSKQIKIVCLSTNPVCMCVSEEELEQRRAQVCTGTSLHLSDQNFEAATNCQKFEN